MSHRIYILSILIILLVFNSCSEKVPKGDIAEIEIINNSTHTIGINISLEYPDTTLTSTSDVGCSKILPNETCNAEIRGGWNDYINSNEKGIIIFFISDVDTIIKYGANVWREDYLILKKLELSESEMEKMDWKISYP